MTEITHVWSDLHALHQNIIHYTNRHEIWATTEAMTWGLINNFNSVVSPDDHTLWLGDMFMGGVEKSMPLMKHFNGTHELILGNHDKPFPVGHSGKPNSKADYWMERYLEYFTEINIHKIMNLGGHKVEFIHFPPHGDSGDIERYQDFRPKDDGETIYVHGHVHDERVLFADRCLHVGVDADFTDWGIKRYHPIPFSVVEEIVSGNW